MAPLKGSKFRLGKNHSKETKQKISISLTGRKRPEQVKQKISQSLMGRIVKSGWKHTEEARKKISEAGEGRRSRLGMKNTDEWREKFRISTSGNKHWNWKNGIKVNNLLEYKRVSESRRRAQKKGSDGIIPLEDWLFIKKKYHYACPACGISEPDIKLVMDHIIPLSRGGQHHKDNIQPLCGGCNNRKFVKVTAYEPNGQLRMVMG